MTQHVAHRASDHIRELNAEIERLEDQRNNLQAKVNEQAAEIERQAHLIIELGAKLHVAEGSPRDRVEQFERDELGGKTLNEFLEGREAKPIATIYNCEHMTGHRGCIWHERNWSQDITPRRCSGCPVVVGEKA